MSSHRDAVRLAPRTASIVPVLLVLGLACLQAGAQPAGQAFQGRYIRGTGDKAYLELLDISRRMLEVDPEFQNLAMLYSPDWNGLVEGPKWGAWWIQNSYGPSYCSIPLMTEPFLTFLVNANDLWFRFIGEGKHYKSPFGGWEYVAPDGQLCDAASPGGALHKQGDGRVASHDFGIEFTAAGVVIQAELLLATRDEALLAKYLPLLERSANFLETRRDPKNNLFLVGPAGNLLAPSYAGWKKPDGTYGQAYLAGVSVTTIAALDRLVELETLAGRTEQARLYAARRDLARKGLAALTTDEGYLVRYIDPDGTKHGVFGAARHGYFEATVNHDAVALRVVDDAQARRIYDKIASIPNLRPHKFIVPNYPTYDDMYENGGIFQYGMWVNGGHWSTCEARMMLGYFRLGRYADAAASMNHLLTTFARPFRMDNPMTGCGSDVWFKQDPIHLCYDSFGAPSGMLRGLFEYLYTAQGLTLVPHIPPTITSLEQHFPVRLGQKRIYLSTVGQGPVTAVDVNGQAWADFDPGAVRLPYDKLPARAVVQVRMGGAAGKPFQPQDPSAAPAPDIQAVASESEPTVISANKLPLRIGADSLGGTTFAGEVRLTRVYGRPLTEAQVAALSADPAAAPPAQGELIAQWRMEDVKGGSVPNSGGTGLDARAVGKAEPVEVDGVKALRLAGGWLEVPHDDRLDLCKGGTLEAWVRPGKLDAKGGRLIDKCHVGTCNGYTLDTHPGRSLRLIVEGGAIGFEANLPEGKWCRIVATVEPTGLCKLFLDGKRVASSEVKPGADFRGLKDLCDRLGRFRALLAADGLAGTYEAAHARLVLETVGAYNQRLALLQAGKIAPLPPASSGPANRSYLDAATRLANGLKKVLDGYAKSGDAGQKKLAELWARSEK